MAMEARVVNGSSALKRDTAVPPAGVTKHVPDPAGQALDLLGEAVFVFDGQAQLLGLNQMAREMLDCGDALVPSGDSVRCHHPEQDKLLRQLIEAAGRPAVGRGRASWRMPLSPRARSQEFEAIVARLEGGRVALFVSDPAAGAAPPPQRLCRLYGLTPTEAVVASRLCNGDRVSDIARDLGVAVNTVRGHLKQVFSKTGVHRQAELVSRILGGAARLRL